jgi:ferredoxin/flavodoxin---NADP+ reductase
MTGSISLGDPSANGAPGRSPSGAYFYERVTEVRHWTNRLFSFKTTRNPAFRFTSGQFTMIGLEVDGRPLVRAYSMTSASYDDWLEFYSIKVPDGPLTSRLQHIKEGDTVLIGRKPTGTLVFESLLPGKRVYLLSTGTGLAPFASIVRDPEVYERFETVVLVHGCRETAELEYGRHLVEDLRKSEFLGEMATKQLLYYPTATREAHVHTGRITNLIESGKLFSDLNLPPLEHENDRVMLCGSPEMLKDLRDAMIARNFAEGSGGAPGEYVIEKAFVER